MLQHNHDRRRSPWGRTPPTLITAFTLVELLVVISIIAVLIALLLPALKHARGEAMTIKCASNMRQWSTAVYNYTIDHNGEIPFFADCFACPEGSGEWWTQKVAPYYSSGSGETQTTGEVASRDCPAEENTAIGVHYGYYNIHDQFNRNFPIAPFVYERDNEIRMRDFPPVTWNSPLMRDPSKWIMLLDTSGPGGYMYSPNLWDFQVDTDGDGIKDSHYGVLNAGGPVYNGAKPFVHQDSCNIGMPDGHVERMRYKVFFKKKNGYWLPRRPWGKKAAYKRP